MAAMICMAWDGEAHVGPDCDLAFELSHMIKSRLKEIRGMSRQGNDLVVNRA